MNSEFIYTYIYIYSVNIHIPLRKDYALYIALAAAGSRVSWTRNALAGLPTTAH